MNKKERFGKIAILIMACMAGMVFLSSVAMATGTVHNINTEIDYDTIQLAIDVANIGDEIHVDSRTYYENVNISKQLILKGVGNPVVNASGAGSAITLSADGIRLEGFTVTGGASFWTGSYYYYGGGIKVTSSNNILIGNNADSNGNSCGICLFPYSNNNTLSDNNASNNSVGISLSLSNNNTLKSNNVRLDNQAGFYLAGSSENKLRGNNGNILLSQSNNNIFSNGKGNTIWLSESNNNTLTGNDVSYGGITLIQSDNNTLTNNNINLTIGFSIYSEYSNNNKIYHNNLKNELNQVWDNTNTNFWDSGYPSGGNYWRDYTGIDSDSDGIGDTAYLILGGGNNADRYPLMAPYVDQIALIPNQPSDLKQLKSDGSTAIATGGTISERTVVFKGNVSDSDGDNVRLQIELRNSSEYDNTFNESKGGLKESDIVPNGSEAVITVRYLINDSYHWRARTVDEYGNKGDWQDFGDNLVSEADFVINSQAFSFVQLTDVHIGPDAEECFQNSINLADWSKKCGSLWLQSLDKFIGVIEKVKADNPDFVIVTGDIVEWNNPSFYQGFDAQISKLNKDIYVVPGNHDRRGVRNPENKLEAALPCEDASCLGNYSEYVGSKRVSGITGDYMHGSGYYFDKSGYRFIGLDSGYDPSLIEVAADRKLLDVPTGSGLSQEQVQYVNESASYGKTIVFMHHPTNDTDNNYNTISRNREYFINTELRKDIELTLTGHTHDFRYFTTYQRAGPFSPRNFLVQTRSATKGNFPGYSIIDIGQNKDGEILVHDIKILGSEIIPGKILSVHSPADLHVYDEFGRHTGINESGGIDNQIPNSYYIQGAKIGNITLPESVLLFNNTLNYSSEIVSNFSKENITSEQSYFNFTIEERTGGAIKTTSYNNVTIEVNSRAYIENISQSDYSMQVDLDNDSAIDAVKTPDTVITDYTPVVAIIFPANNSEWDQGQAIAFSGVGSDPEDGVLNGLSWISDRDDVVGQGSFTTANLSAGTHRITVRVNNSIGQVNISSIVLTVRDIMPPSMAIDYPPENKIFNNLNINVRGIAYDDSGIAKVTVNGIQAGQENWNASLELNEGENSIEVMATDNKGFSIIINRTVYYNSSLASDTEPPSAITNLTYTTGYDNTSGAWINWTWDNPQDADFGYAIIYLDGIPMGNITRSYMNFTGLSSVADYNISVLTADIVDNVNHTEVSGTARTSADTPLPEIRYINGTVIDSVNKTNISGVQVSIDGGNSTTSDSFGFYSLAVSEGEYSLKAKFDPRYYVSNTIMVSTVGKVVATQDIELIEKPKGNIRGNVIRN